LERKNLFFWAGEKKRVSSIKEVVNMKEMKFDVKCVKDCLKRYGVVFSVRKWKSYSDKEVVMVKDVGMCEKLRVCEVHGIDDIRRFGELSGFKSNEEWWNKVKSFGAQDGWLYRVKIIEEASASSITGGSYV